MQPDEVTAASADVVAAVLRDPSGFLAEAADAVPGWSSKYGGAEGVAQLTSMLHDHLAELTKANAEVRTAAVLFLRRRLSLLAVARLLGVSKGAVQHVERRAERESSPPARFARLRDPASWDS